MNLGGRGRRAVFQLSNNQTPGEDKQTTKDDEQSSWVTVHIKEASGRTNYLLAMLCHAIAEQCCACACLSDRLSVNFSCFLKSLSGRPMAGAI